MLERGRHGRSGRSTAPRQDASIVASAGRLDRFRLRARTIFLASRGRCRLVGRHCRGTVLHEARRRRRRKDRRSGHHAAAAAVEGAAAVFSGTDAVLSGPACGRATAGRRIGAPPCWTKPISSCRRAWPSSRSTRPTGALIHRTGAAAGHRETIATLDHFRTPIETGAAGPARRAGPTRILRDGRRVVPLVRLHPAPAARFGRSGRAVAVEASSPNGCRVSTAPWPWRGGRHGAGGIRAGGPPQKPGPTALPSLQDGAVAEAANGMPLIATPAAVDGRAQGGRAPHAAAHAWRPPQRSRARPDRPRSVARQRLRRAAAPQPPIAMPAT